MFVCLCQSGNTALTIAQRLGYISVVDTLKVVTEEVITTTTVSSISHSVVLSHFTLQARACVCVLAWRWEAQG